MTDISFTLTHSYAGSEWTLDGDKYSGLTWLSDTKKPTKKELETAYPLAVAAKESERAAKIAAHDSAVAKLTALGLNSLEVQAIIGGI
jgi:hypothetical protein